MDSILMLSQHTMNADSYHVGKRAKGEKMSALAAGGEFYICLRHVVRTWIEEHPDSPGKKEKVGRVREKLPKKFRTVTQGLTRALKQTLEQVVTEFETDCAVWKWRAPLTGSGPRCPWQNRAEWRKLDVLIVQWHLCEFDEQDTFMHQLHEDFIGQHRLDTHKILDAEMLRQAGYPEQPICVATDGGYITSEDGANGGNKTTAAMCMFRLPKRSAEAERTWKDCEPSILLIRLKVLPVHTGDTETDNDTGKLEALNIAMTTLPVDAVSFTVTDSTAARGKALHLRDHTYRSTR
jgi:hypothetical protein